VSVDPLMIGGGFRDHPQAGGCYGNIKQHHYIHNDPDDVNTTVGLV